MKKLTVAIVPASAGFFLSGAIAQTLMPAAPPTDWTGLLIIGGFALAIAALVVWHNRHPTTADKAIGAAVTSAHGLLASLTNLLHAQHATIDQHASTIATLTGATPATHDAAAPVAGFVLPSTSNAPSGGFVLPTATPSSLPWKT